MKVPCHHVHPGVCCSELALHARLAATSFKEAVQAWPAGAAMRVEATAEDGSTQFEYRFICFPTHDTVVLANVMTDGCSVALDVHDDDGIIFQCSQRLILDMWQKCESSKLKTLAVLRLQAIMPASFAEASKIVPKLDLSKEAAADAGITFWPSLPPAPPLDTPGMAVSQNSMAEALSVMRKGLAGYTGSYSMDVQGR